VLRPRRRQFPLALQRPLLVGPRGAAPALSPPFKENAARTWLERECATQADERTARPATFEVRLRARGPGWRASPALEARAHAGTRSRSTSRRRPLLARSVSCRGGFDRIAGAPTAPWCAAATTRTGRAPRRTKSGSCFRRAATSSRSRSTCWPPRKNLPPIGGGAGVPRLRTTDWPPRWRGSTLDDVKSERSRNLLRGLVDGIAGGHLRAGARRSDDWWRFHDGVSAPRD
jgi:hypothetical protein